MAGRAAIRPVRASDCDAVLPLLQRMGMALRHTPESWRLRWRRLFEQSPALALRPEVGGGFVCEGEHGISGYFGSIPVLYRHRGRRLVAGMATGWAVDPSARGRGAFLAQRYFRQPHVDLLVNATANDASAALSQHFGCLKTASAWIASGLRWPTDPGSLLARSLPGGALLGPLLRAGLALARLCPPRPPADATRVDEQALGEVGAELDAFFEAVAASDPRLLADRSAACLRWRFEAPHLETALLCLRRGGELAGFAVLEYRTGEARGLRTAALLDLLVAPGDAVAGDALWWACCEHARGQGADLFEAPLAITSAGAGALRRARHLRLAGRSRDVFVLARDEALAAELGADGAGPGSWYLSEFDRDASI